MKFFLFLTSLFLLLDSVPEKTTSIVKNVRMEVRDIDNTLENAEITHHVLPKEKYETSDGIYIKNTMEVKSHTFDVFTYDNNCENLENVHKEVKSNKTKITFNVISNEGWRNFMEEQKKKKKKGQYQVALMEIKVVKMRYGQRIYEVLQYQELQSMEVEFNQLQRLVQTGFEEGNDLEVKDAIRNIDQWKSNLKLFKEKMGLNNYSFTPEQVKLIESIIKISK